MKTLTINLEDDVYDHINMLAEFCGMTPVSVIEMLVALTKKMDTVTTANPALREEIEATDAGKIIEGIVGAAVERKVHGP